MRCKNNTFLLIVQEKVGKFHYIHNKSNTKYFLFLSVLMKFKKEAPYNSLKFATAVNQCSNAYASIK